MKKNNFYNSSNDAGINMRHEMINFLDGSIFEVSKSQRGVVRKIRLNDVGDPVLCPCVDNITREQDRDYFCPICLGERYLWDEKFIDFYKVQRGDANGLHSKEVGNIHTDINIFYLSYTANINKYDKLIEITLNLDGTVRYPIKRVDMWQITEIVELRLDFGKVEFIKAFARKEDAKYLKS